MDWDDLRFVLALHREGTLARAGKRLAVTHTTVGRRLKAMEASLGVRLFDRTPDGFVATASGQDLADVASQIERDVLSAQGRVLGQDTKLRGPLRVSTMDIFFCGFPEIFESFVTRYPSVELTVTTEIEQVSLTRRETDVALRLTNTPPEYLVGRKVGRVHFAVYAARSLVDRIGEDAPLDAFPWLGLKDPQGQRWLRAWQAEHAPQARTILSVDENSWVQMSAIRSGIGVFFAPCFGGDVHPDLVRVSPIQEAFAHDVWLLVLRELRSASRVRAFMDHVREAFQARAGALAGEPQSTQR